MAEIVGIATSLVGLVLELGKCIVVPIKRQFGYLCCFNSHIKSLRDEAKKLEDARVELQGRVDEAEGNGEEIVPQAKTWLTSADNEIQVNMNGIENEIPKVQGGCLTIISRYSLSKKAKKTTDAMKELRDDSSKFDNISSPTAPAATVPIPLGETYEFESRKKIEEEIMEALRSKEVNVIGIWGMGGVGKTTMAKRIMKRVIEEHLFDEAVITIVGQQPDMLKIQSEISEQLHLTLGVQTLYSRAHQLRGRLKGTKRSLIVVDDIWQIFKLEDLGIPCKSGDEKYCTVLLTSRNRDVLKAMKFQRVYAIEALSEEEAWLLFTEKSGLCSNDSDLHSLAQNIAKECKGLPIALITVGSMLGDNKLKHIWEAALQQLKDANPIGMPRVLQEVYNPLKLSYDYLDSKHAKSLFLLCCLFPEDSDISLEYLTLFCMGLHIFEGLRSLEQVRNGVFLVVEMLKSRFLLLDGSYSHAVRMHDVVRDIAIFIASKIGLVDVNPGHNSYSKCEWISFFPQERNELPKTLSQDFPSLHILMMHWPWFKQIEDFSFLQGMKELSVLSFRCVASKSIPQTMQLLKNLRTLHLVSCQLENISAVGELLNLEILSCCSCFGVKELPTEIGRLNRLKLLAFEGCINLTTVPPGVLSNLIELEELTMVNSFKGWESANEKEKGSGIVNVSLHELQLLRNLTCLNIEIEDYTLAAEEIHFTSKIVKYDIKLGGLILSSSAILCSCRERFEKKMSLNLPRPITVGNWIHILARSSEKLCLAGDRCDILQTPNVKLLGFKNCSTVKHLVDTTSIDDNFTITKKDSFHIFSELKYLSLSKLPSFEEICNGPIPRGSKSFKNLQQIEIEGLPMLKHLWRNPNQDVSFSNLRKIDIIDCGNLRNLFQLEMAMAQDVFLQLEELIIQSCGMMDEVFLIKEIETHGEITSHLTFPQLKTLRLTNLENLTIFSGGIESIEFPALTDMDIVNCPNLISLVSSSMENHQNSASSQDDDSIHLLCKVKFSSLRTLLIKGYNNFGNIWCHQIPDGFFIGLQQLVIAKCDSIRSLFSSAIARNLVNLKDLTINRCKEMVKVIEDGEEIIRETNCPLLFRSLQYLRLESLPKLGSFCKWRCAIELPMLKYMSIVECPMMKVFTLGSSISAPILELIVWSKLTSTVSPIGRNGHDDDIFHLFCNQKVTFGMLMSLAIKECNDISRMWCRQILDSFFTRLNQLNIDGCDSIRSLFSYAIVRNLVNLKALTINRCKEMVKVIEDDEEIIRETNCPLLLFSSLQHLFLKSLPKLGSFCEGRCAIELPMLEHLSIVECPMMKVFTMGSLISAPKLKHIVWSKLTSTVSLNGPDVHDDDTFHVFCNQKVTFGMLTYLKIEECNVISSLWCHHISNSFFTRLIELDIVGCDNIRSLFSSAIARNLVNLGILSIVTCKEMVKVIEDEEEMNRETSLSLLFPNLQDLSLDSLPKLGSFCEWRCDIELLMLKVLAIRMCPMMKVFTMGSSIRTPKLVSIVMDHQWKAVGDLNEFMKLQNHIEGGEIAKVEIV